MNYPRLSLCTIFILLIVFGMLRITASTSAEGAKQYFGKGLTRSDYYIDGQEIAGLWGGKGAEQLHVSGEVDQQAYFRLCDNQHPQTGKQLTPRVKDNRRVGYDFTFSAPKPVSVLYEMSGDERILDAFRQSVKETMEEIESEMKCRVRKGGANEDRETGNMVWAEFVHFTGRPVSDKEFGLESVYDSDGSDRGWSAKLSGAPDPHLHAHVYAFNATFDKAEGRWKAGQFGDLKRDGYYYEKAFHSRFAARLNDLGYSTEKKGNSFGLVGVPQSITDKFSRRRNVIEKEAKEQSITDPKGKHAIGYWGRESKSADVAKSELRELWKGALSNKERTALDGIIKGPPKPLHKVTAEKAMTYAIQHCSYHYSTFPEKRLKAEALIYGVGSVLPDNVSFKDHPEIIYRNIDGQRVMTTRKVLAEESGMLQYARDGMGKCLPFGYRETEFAGLDAEGKAAAMHVMTSRDRVTGIRGGPGTGKTTFLKTLVPAIEARGDKVYAFAQSTTASRGTLREAGFKDAQTLEMLFKSEKTQEKVNGAVLLVDEASLNGTRDMVRLFNVAKQQKVKRVVLVGDYYQHGSVLAGEPYRILESDAGVKYARLTTIRRQKVAEYKKAVEAINAGTPQGAQKGFDMLDKMGAIISAPGEARHELLIRDYLDAAEAKRTALLIAPTHAEGNRLTEELRDKLRLQGDLRGKEEPYITRDPTKWTEAEKGDSRNYEPGMVVEFYQQTRGARRQVNGVRETVGGFKRGECAVVTGVDGDAVSVLRQNGRTAILPKETEPFQVFRPRELRVAETGERVRITQNGSINNEAGKKVPVSNGDIFTTEGRTAEGDIKLAGGLILPKTYGHFRRGYVDTSRAGQSKTVDRVFIALGNESHGATNRREWLVDVTRGQEACKVYVEDKKEVRNAIARSGQQLTATELVKLKTPDPNKPVQERLARNRILGYLQERIQPVIDRWREKIRYQREERGRRYA